MFTLLYTVEEILKGTNAKILIANTVSTDIISQPISVQNLASQIFNSDIEIVSEVFPNLTVKMPWYNMSNHEVLDFQWCWS